MIAPPHDANPLLEYLGIRLTEWEPGRAEFGIEVEARHLNRAGTLQGGVIATILDAACGYAGLWIEAEPEPSNAATAMLTISYLDKASAGRLTATGHVTRAGRSLYFSSGELVDEAGSVIATAQGTFKRRRLRS